MTHTDDLEFALPIPQATFQMADRLAARLPSSKTAQVRQNTIAVSVVENYLQLMGIVVDRAASDSSNPVMQLSADIADLMIPNAGRLECRPLLPNAQTCFVPPEVWEDRIGYVVVRIDEAQQQASLLGFVQTVDAEEFPIDQLQPIEALLDHLDRLLHPIATNLTVLSQWLQGAIETGWQSIESLLNPPQLAFRGQPSSTTRRGKSIALGNHAIALTIELTEVVDEIEILLRVHPLDAPTLPPQLQLTILDDEGTVFLEARSRQADDFLQLRFSGSAGERFNVQLAIAQSSVTEEFII
ncbi:DUF1822 family protein [Microcoleus sp. FACHB-1515]|uniref:DUF1822 family protein n=1 Tax=Cyanophyceae TaxID=3028117 RepID=UPI00168610AB|nr:DUF1822 family protein [Microcoleus sp. FACHB-1515]MBD2088576.1 DUF1822 family protein [Microcoleus sp. FACHB-1515]